MEYHDVYAHVCNMYPNSSRWQKRVDQMAPAQVFAIYKRDQLQKHNATNPMVAPQEEQLQLNL